MSIRHAKSVTSKRLTISDLGERDFIQQYIAPLLSTDFGNILLDDCAVLTLGETTLLLSVDHSPKRTLLSLLDIGTPADAGHYHVTANLSDIAAMGGRGLGILLVLGLQGTEDTEYLAAFLQGIDEAMHDYEIRLLGGDTKHTSARATIVTAVGQAIDGGPLSRYGAKVGDLIYITDDAVGECLENYIYIARNRNEVSENLSIFRPKAKLTFGQTLARSRIATSCIDMSDGLLASAEQLGALNDVNFVLDIEEIPVASSPVSHRHVDWRNLIFNVGGDFGLMFTTSNSNSQMAEYIGARRIGYVAHGEGGVCQRTLSEYDIHLAPWEHFKTVEARTDEILSFV